MNIKDDDFAYYQYDPYLGLTLKIIEMNYINLQVTMEIFFEI